MTITKHGRLYKISANNSKRVFLGIDYQKTFKQASEYFWKIKF